MIINFEHFKKYFDISYEFKEYTNEYRVILLAKCTSDIVFQATIPSSGEKTIIDNIFNNDEEAENEVIKYIYDYFKNEIDQKVDACQEKINQYNLKIEKQLLDNNINFLTERISQADVLTLNADNLVSVEITVNSSNYFDLSLRVGNDKFYIVKNVNDFLKALYANQEIAYGKKLSFAHTLANFKEKYHPFLNFLKTSVPVAYRYNSKEIRLAPNLIDSFFKSVKDLDIIYNGKPYLVRLNEIDPVFKVNDDYSLVVENTTNYEIVSYKEEVFLFDDKAHVIDKIKDDIKTKNLFIFTRNLQGFPFERYQDRLKNEILPLMGDAVTLAPSLKSTLTVDDIEFRTYFDYDNKKILVNTKFFKGETEIKRTELPNFTKGRLNKLDAIYNSLGVIDGEIENEDAIYNFFKLDFTQIKKTTNVYLSESITNKTISDMSKQTLRINYNNNLIDAFLEESEYSDEELSKILSAIKKHKKYILLNDNKIIDLEGEESKNFFDLASTMELDEKTPKTIKRVPLYQSLKLYAHENNVTMDDYVSNMINDIANFKNANLNPATMNAHLRPYQLEGFKWLSILKKYHLGGILADDMGLGKTLEIISLINSDDTEKPSLIVCPKSLIFNWKNELEKFTPNLPGIEIYGSADARKEEITKIDYNKKIVYITSYESVLKDIELYKQEFNYLILDEAQAIKNVDTLKAKGVKKLKASYKFALTGTPIENSVLDLWSIFDFIMPSYLSKLNEFKSNIEKSELFQQTTIKKVSPFILRRTKGDVLKDLPAKFERIVTSEMDNTQRGLYDAHCKVARDILDNSGKVFDILPLLTRLRQLCVDPNLFIENYKGTSCKMIQLNEIISEYYQEHKIIIFSQFVEALKLIEESLTKKNINYLMLTGKTEAKERINLANKFNNDESIRIFLVSLKAGGTGLNLIGADTIIHLDPWWNASVENQATDRAHRIGQTKNVEVIKMICENSIEQRVVELQNMKKDIIDQFIASDDQRITSISTADLKYILKD